MRFTGNGRIEPENDAAVRALRAMAIRRSNFLHLGSSAGGDSADVICTRTGTARLKGINPQRYLRYVLEPIADHKVNRIDKLLPWGVAAPIAPDAQEEQDLPLAA